MKETSTKRKRKNKSFKLLMKETKIIEVDSIPGVTEQNLFPEKLEMANRMLKKLKLPNK